MLVDIDKDKKPKRIWMTLLTPGLEEFGRIQGVIKDSLEIEQGTKQHDVLRFSLSRVMYTDIWLQKTDVGQKNADQSLL